MKGNSDQLAQWIFAAAATCGQADAFLARELADSAAHFLSRDDDESPQRMAELAMTVVRELGHPHVAAAMALHGPPAPRSAGYLDWNDSDDPNRAREWALRHGFPANLVAAHEAGLLTIGDLDIPRQFVGLHCDLTLSPPPPGTTVRSLSLSGVEKWWARIGPQAAVDRLRELAATCERVIVHLNVPGELPSDLPSGHLFAEWEQMRVDERRAAESLTVATELARLRCPVRVCWHWAKSDGPVSASALAIAAVALSHGNWLFVGARSTTHLPKVIAQSAILHLDALWNYLGPAERNTLHYLEKLVSLFRLAASVGRAKQELLRQTDAASGFLADRAGLALATAGFAQLVNLMRLSDEGATTLAELIGRRLLSVSGGHLNIDVTFTSPVLQAGDVIPRVELGTGRAVNEQIVLATRWHEVLAPVVQLGVDATHRLAGEQMVRSLAAIFAVRPRVQVGLVNATKS